MASSEFASGLLTGALLGLAVGILVAPRSGKDTRKKIAGAASQQADELANKWDDAKSETRKQLNKYEDKAASAASKLSDNAEDKADHLADEAKSAIDKVKDVFRIN